MGQNDQYDTALERYLNEVSSIVPLKPDEEAEWLERAAKGNQKAEAVLAKAYLPKVVSIAKGYHANNISFEDIINEGNIGLINAIRKYKSERGISFAAYAARHIRESITNSLAAHHELVLKPTVGKNVRAKIVHAIRTFQQKNERRPDISEIAAIVGMPEQQVMDIIQSSHTSRSIDAPVRRGGNVSMADIIAGTQNASQNLDIDSHQLGEMMKEAANSLGERERLVAIDYYGLDGVQLNMAEIAEKYGLKRERVRQIRDSATRKLRKKLRNINEQ